MPASERLLTRDLSTALSGIVLFVAGGKSWTVDDALAAAVFRNDLEDAIRETLELAGAEELADELGHEPDSDDLQAFSDRYRYDRDLISAGETEEWIRARGMRTEDFTGWILRRWYLENLPAGNLVVEPENLSELLHVHLWMSGLMEDLDTALQRRVAADLDLAEKGEITSASTAMQHFLDLHRLDESALPAWLSGAGRDHAWLLEMARMEAAYDRTCALALTEGARAQQLDSMGLSLARIGIETLEVDSEAVAREAYLCVREDRVSLSETARESGFCSEYSEVWLDRVEPGLGQRLFCTEVGEALEPVEVDGGFRVFQVMRRFEPSIHEPAVARRLDALIIEQTFSALCPRYIQPSEAFRTAR